MAKEKRCTACGKKLDPGEGIGSVKGLPGALLCKRCYRDQTRPN